MKIGIFLGSPGINGGTYVIYEHASRLQQKGHQVILVTKQKVEPEEHAWHSSAHELAWLPLEQARAESFDIVLATWWQSPFLLHELQSIHYAYFVQSIETSFFPPPDPLDYADLNNTIMQDLCEQTYSYALPIITEAAWIQDYIYKNYNNYPELVRNGIRKDIYTTDGRAIAPCEQGKFRVLVEGPVDVGYKNVPASIRLAQQAGADEIWLLTSSDINQYQDVDRVFSQVPIHETPAVYRSCDLLLKLSYVEGMFGPPLEMFHCGGTALVYDVTGHDEYIVHNQNSYVVAREEEAEVVHLLRHLKQHPKELARLKQGAAQTALSWPDWQECSAAFEKVLFEITDRRPASREYLKQHTHKILATKDLLLKATAHDIFTDREKAVWAGEATDKNNFAEFYWGGNEKFNKKHSQWQHYPSEEWATVSFEMKVEEIPLWLRIDPSVRIGIIDIECITVLNRTQKTEIMTFQEPDDFQALFLTGDLKWLFSDRKNIVFSYGRDPMLYLPAVEQDKADAGDCLEVTIRLKETGVQQFFNDHPSYCTKNIEYAKTTDEQPASWWKRILG